MTLLRRYPLLCALLLCSLLQAGPSTAEPGSRLTPDEARGRQLYLTGVGTEPFSARFGPERIELPGEVTTCGSCHGYDGRGRSESGIAASDITWPALTKRYGHVHPGGRVHPPLDPGGLRVLITQGVYPDGTPVDPAMPIYTLSSEDLDNLVAYLQRLGSLLDPGVGEHRLRVGFLHLDRQDPETGNALGDVLRTYFGQLNAAGGIYGRQIEMVVVAPPADPERLEPWLLDQDLFALVAPFTPDREELLAKASQHTEIPLIGLYTLFPPEDFAANRYAFYLFPGLAEQFELLYVGASRGAPGAMQTAILVGGDERLEPAARQLQRRLQADGQKLAIRQIPGNQAELAALIDTLQEQQVGLVLLLGDSSEGLAFLRAAAGQGWFPKVGLAGQLAGELLLEIPASQREQLILALPTIASDRHPAPTTAALLQKLADPARLPAQVAALAAAELFSEALRRSGQRLDRRGLVAALEKTYRFETGLIPPLSFSANRRIGSDGIYLVTLQGRERSTAPEEFHIEWVTPPTRR